MNVDYSKFLIKYPKKDALRHVELVKLAGTGTKVILWMSDYGYTGQLIARVQAVDPYLFDALLIVAEAQPHYKLGAMFSESTVRFSIWLYKEEKCICGAAYTSFPQFHSRYCPLDGKGD